VGRYLTIAVPLGSRVVLDEVAVFAANSCPARTATSADQFPGTNCAAGAPLGAVCIHRCRLGTTQISGAGTSTCNGESWNDPPLVCGAPCGNLPVPVEGATCGSALYANNFTFPDSVASLALVDLSAAPPALGANVAVIDGTLQLNARRDCGGELTVAVGATAPAAWLTTFRWSARILPRANSRAGIVWKAQDAGNMLRFVLDTDSGLHAIQRLNWGAVFTLTTVYLPLQPGLWYTVTLDSVNTYSHQISVNGVPLVSTVDYSWSQGGRPGFYAQGAATFDDAEFSVDCTGSGFCQGLPGSQCGFVCPAGMTATGNTLYTCGGTAMVPTWSPAFNMLCTLTPPVFPTAVISVPENSLKNTPVGSPLQASSLAPGYSLLYTILAVYKWGNTTLTQPFPFYVDACTGQVKVLTTACAPAAGTPSSAPSAWTRATFRGARRRSRRRRAFLTWCTTPLTTSWCALRRW